MNIREFANKWNRPIDNNFDDGIDELERALIDGPSKTDIENWNISVDELKAALEELNNAQNQHI